MTDYQAEAEKLAERIREFFNIGSLEGGCEHQPGEDFLCWQCENDIIVREAKAALLAAYAGGAEEEREACAMKADICYHGPGDYGCAHGQEIAAAIRARAERHEEKG